MKKLSIILCFILPVFAEAGRVFYVTQKGNDRNDGRSWATAFATLYTAMEAAAKVATDKAPSEVWIASGTYQVYPVAIGMSNNVGIYGGFVGTETSKEERVVGNATTYLDGNNHNSVVAFAGNEENPITSSAKLDNVVIRNAGGAYSNDGYGIYISGCASPEITNCSVRDNNAGGIYIMDASMDASPILKNCYFGASMYNIGASPTLINCCFKGCSGVGMNNSLSNPTLINCTFFNNGDVALFNEQSSPTLINCTFFRNNRFGMRNTVRSCPTLINCIFWGDNALNAVEIFSDSGCAPTIDTCVIKGGYSGHGTCTNIIVANPMLGNIKFSGRIFTIPVLAGSSAIGNGKPIEGVDTDARGFKRSTTAPTIGAHEVINPTITSQPQDKNFWVDKTEEVSMAISANAVFGDVTYQWQKYENEDWINIDGATSEILTLENLTEAFSGSKYRCVVSNAIDGGYVVSDEATITLVPDATQAALSNSKITIVNGGRGHLEVESDAVEPTYKWYYSTNTGVDWTEIGGETNPWLDFAADSSMNRRQFKCVVTDGGGTSVESNKAVLIINSSAITISQDIEDTLAYVGRESVLSVSANSSAALAYQWQVSTDGGESFQNIGGATTPSLSLTPADYSLSGNVYRLKIDNGGGYIYSNAATFTVFKNAEITKQPADLIVWNAKNALFEVQVSGDGELAYQWQLSTDGGENWNDIGGATHAALELENVSVAMDGNKYRCAVSNGGSAGAVSNAATLTVYKTLSITAQPENSHTFAGDTAQFLVAVDAQGDVFYQWQELINSEWLDIEAATAPQFAVENMQAGFDGRKFRAVITNGGDTFVSEIATLSLATPVAITSQPEIIETAYIGTFAKFTVEASGYAPQFQWYVSGNYGTDIGVEIEGATSKTLTVLVADESVLENIYFCKISNAKSEASSDLVYIENVEPLNPYQAWAAENGLSGDDALPSATPRGDGIPNIEKFAFGLDASKPASYADNPYFSRTSDGSSLNLSFPVSVDAEGAASVKAMKSTDLVNWTEVSATQTGTSQDGKFNLYKASAEIPAGGKIFIKLNVEE